MFFGLFAVTSDQSIAFAWVAYGFVLLQGLLGGLIFAVRLYKARGSDLKSLQSAD